MRTMQIQTLWIGERLSQIERLGLASFLAHGHRVQLHAYVDVGGVPEGVEMRDAGAIIPARNVFRYRNKPSYSGFSNWFRYELLHRQGGCWVDTDVVCLRPFAFSDELVFGKEDDERICTAVIGAQSPGHPVFAHLAAQCEDPHRWLAYDTYREKRRKLVRRYLRGTQRNDLKWGETGPRGFSLALRHFGLSHLARPFTCFYPVTCSCWSSLFDETFKDHPEFFAGSHAVHLWHEMTRRDPNFDKAARFSEHSFFGRLQRRYLPDDPAR